MTDLEVPRDAVFASASLVAHLVRGALAVLLMTVAARFQTAAPLGSLALGVAALIAIRGCPVCWTIGLFETLARKGRPRSPAVQPRLKPRSLNDLAGGR